MLRPDRRTRRTLAIALTTLSTLALIWPAAIVAGRPASTARSTAAVDAGAPRSERQPSVQGVGRQPLRGNGGANRTQPLQHLAGGINGRHGASESDGGVGIQAVPPASVQATNSGAPAADSFGPWEGLDQAAAGSIEPPDPWVAVGPDDVVQTVDNVIRFTNREGTPRVADVDVYDFFAFDELVAGDPDFITGVGDPRFIYDAKRNRWLGMTLAWHCDTDGGGAADDSLGFVWGAISTTGDPTGDYYQFYVLYNEYLPDFPGLGTSGDKFTISANELLLTNQADCVNTIDPTAGFPGGSLMTFDWAQMLTFPALPDGAYEFDDSWFALRPALSPQSLSNTIFVVGEKILPDPSTTSNVVYMTITGTNAANTVNVSAERDLTDLGVVPPFVDPPAPHDPGGQLDANIIDRRPTDAIWQDNVLTFASTTECDPAGGASEDRNCARVTQLNTSSATPTRVQDMLIATSNRDTWYPGIGLSASGILHVVYTRSGTTEGMSSYDRYQLPGDPKHSLSTPRKLANGGAVAYPGDRWGDYVGVAQDPRDTNAVWQGNQYTKSNGTWGTRVSELQTAGATFVPVAPVRLLDSRPGFGIGLTGTFQANVPRTVDIAGRLGIPNNAVAITGNLTIVGQTQAGYATVTPNPSVNPPTASLNFPLKDNRGNNLTAPLGATGGVSIVYKAANGNTAHFVLDVTGYFLNNTTGATYKTLTPVRVLDSRPDYKIGATTAFQANQNRQFQVRGVFGIPNEAIAVTGNLAVTGQTQGGYVSLSSTQPPALPATSNLNFPRGDTRANGVTIKLSSTGTIWAVYKAPDGNTAHLIFDVSGYYVQDLTGARFVPLTPGRRMDTRFAAPQQGLSGPFLANTPRSLDVEPYQGVPANATAITGNLTVVSPTRGGYVSMTPTAIVPPPTANINFPTGDVRGNGVTGPLSGPGNVAFVYVASNGTTHLVFDLTGYFR
ncbi:MAG TPA: hypothetical protein VFO05_04410 [Candidatus Limnocylindrales bacterium]|nr:hypothetical protein [Candidatus Limnocylindrales bacterium]